MPEKKFYQSKKWISWIIGLVILAGILITALVTQSFVWAMAMFMSIGILAISVITVSYISGQAALDRFIEGVKGIKSEEDKEK